MSEATSHRREMQTALQSLNLPDSPVIQLSVCSVAELLLPLDAKFIGSQHEKCMVRAHLAANAVRNNLPIEFVRLQCLWRFDVAVTHTAADAALTLPRHDWLAQAKAALQAIGVDPGPDARKLMAEGGWGYPRREDESAGRVRWSPVWKYKARTPEERAILSAKVMERVRNQTQEQKAAEMKRRG
jgi:hypothetical protein